MKSFMLNHLWEGGKGFATFWASNTCCMPPNVLMHLGLAYGNIIALLTADLLWTVYVWAVTAVLFDVIKGNTALVTRIWLVIRMQWTEVSVKSHTRLGRAITNCTHSLYRDTSIPNRLSLNWCIIQERIRVSIWMGTVPCWWILRDRS